MQHRRLFHPNFKPQLSHSRATYFVKTVYQSGLSGNEGARCAGGLSLNQLISNHLVMDQLATFSSSKWLCCKPVIFFCFEALNPYSKQPSPDLFVYRSNLTVF